MKTISITIEGTTAYLMHRFGEQAEVDGAKQTRRIAIQEEEPRKAAERVSYRDAEQNLYFPGAAIARLLREAGGAHKQKGSRKSVKYIVPAAVLVCDDTILFHQPNGKKKTKPITEFEVDSRPVTIPATKGRIMRHRPKLPTWAATFTIEIADDMLPVEVVHQLLEEGGRGIGIGDFRPEKGGPFGRFRVVSFRASN